jgi:hypothetical protein
VRAHALTREERARGGRVKAAKRRARGRDVEAADRIIWLLRRVGEEAAADAVQRTLLPWTLEKPWEQPSTPFRKAQERIAKLEALVEELLADDALTAAMEKDLRRPQGGGGAALNCD